MKGHKFVETVRMFVAGGKGGNGCASFCREKFVPRGGPNGGHGGDGGNVLLRADRNTASLISAGYSPHRQAENGGNGKGRDKHGRNGQDLVIKVPCGTEVRDDKTGTLLGDLVEHETDLTVARGGGGGRGNCSWKRGSPLAIDESTPGEAGERNVIRLELKVVADIGLVGMPNAGKSSLLRRISRAHPKVGAFPFTTLHPVIGTIEYEDFTDLTVVDIPGLIKNAHSGAGLGDKFLRHLERARFLVFVIDMAGVDGRNPFEDYHALLNELRLHGKGLAERPALIAANKMDLREARDNLDEFKHAVEQKIFPVSTVTGDGIEEFKRALRAALTDSD